MSISGAKVTSKETLMEDKCSNYLIFLDYIARDLIHKGLYTSEHKLLREIVRDYAQRQLETEQRVILGLEKQFISWEKFNDAIMNIATPEQEDIFFEWETARDSRKAWQELIDQLA